VERRDSESEWLAAKNPRWGQRTRHLDHYFVDTLTAEATIDEVKKAIDAAA